MLEIGGGQNTFVSGEAVSGIAVDNLQLLAKGMLVTPDTEGSFSVTLDAAANVLEVGSDTSVRAAEVIEEYTGIPTRVPPHPALVTPIGMAINNNPEDFA